MVVERIKKLEDMEMYPDDEKTDEEKRKERYLEEKDRERKEAENNGDYYGSHRDYCDG